MSRNPSNGTFQRVAVDNKRVINYLPLLSSSHFSWTATTNGPPNITNQISTLSSIRICASTIHWFYQIEFWGFPKSKTRIFFIVVQRRGVHISNPHRPLNTNQPNVYSIFYKNWSHAPVIYFIILLILLFSRTKQLYLLFSRTKQLYLLFSRTKQLYLMWFRGGYKSPIHKC